MHRRILFVALLILGLLLVTGCGLLREPEQASAPIEAIPLESETAVEPTAVPETTVEAPAATETAAEEAPAEPTAPQPEEETAAGGPVIFAIVQDQSQVRFELDEDLRGQRITVVGTTNQVAGELSVDPADLTATQVGVLQINARTLATDNNFRNRAIQNEILDTGAFEFITFTPTAVDGLPSGAAVGDEVTFTITGDLTIRDITAPATFDVAATLVSADQIAGTAGTVINRSDFGLTIPSVPNVANVEEEVELYIDFVANATS